MKYRLVNIGRGDIVIDKNTYGLIRDFNDAPIKGSYRNLNNDIAIDEDNHIVIPGSARELYFGAEDAVKKDIINAASFYHKELLSERNPEYEHWFKKYTEEGQNGADPYENNNHYDYAKYYEEVVKDNEEFEDKRNKSGAPIDSQYMNSSNPNYNEFFPMAPKSVVSEKDIQAINQDLNFSNFNAPML